VAVGEELRSLDGFRARSLRITSLAEIVPRITSAAHRCVYAFRSVSRAFRSDSHGLRIKGPAAPGP